MALLDDVADYLSSQGVATTATNLFKSTMPSTPDELLALYESGGPGPVRAMGPGPGDALVERPHVQIRARSSRADAARVLCANAYHALDRLPTRTINGVRYLTVLALQSPSFLRGDDVGRTEYVCNFEVIRELATSS